MKTITPELAAHLAGEVTTLATCWKLTRRDGAVMGFTDHNKDILYLSVTYKAATGFTPTSIEAKDDFSVDNLDVEGMLDSASITEADVMAGKYDFAEIEIFTVNYEDLSQGRLWPKTGWLGEVTLKRGQFNVEVRGLSQKLSQNIGQVFSPSCRAVLGDNQCKISLAGHSVTTTVSTVTSSLVFSANALTQAAGHFSGGEVEWLTGANAGRKMEVKEFGSKQVTLVLPMGSSIAVGNQFKIVAGCDKTFQTCKGKFNNVINFRGEPHIPGMDKILETAGTFDAEG